MNDIDREREIKMIVKEMGELDAALIEKITTNSNSEVDWFMTRKARLGERLTALLQQSDVIRCDYCSTVYPRRLPRLDIATPIEHSGWKHEQHNICESCLENHNINHFRKEYYDRHEDD